MDKNKNILEEYKRCCYQDMEQDAKQIISLILNAYSQPNCKINIDDLFSYIPDNELNAWYFKNIDWGIICKIAISAKSRQETYSYLSNVN